MQDPFHTQMQCTLRHRHQSLCENRKSHSPLARLRDPYLYNVSSSSALIYDLYAMAWKFRFIHSMHPNSKECSMVSHAHTHTVSARLRSTYVQTNIYHARHPSLHVPQQNLYYYMYWRKTYVPGTAVPQKIVFQGEKEKRKERRVQESYDIAITSVAEEY